MSDSLSHNEVGSDGRFVGDGERECGEFPYPLLWYVPLVSFGAEFES